MSDLSALDRGIREKLAAAEDKRRLQKKSLQERMFVEERYQRYTPIADRLTQTIIRPRMEKLAEFFDNARFPDSDPSRQHHCLCRLERTVRYPATVELELAVTRDGLCENVLVLYNLQIRPVFFQFEGQAQLGLSLDRVDDGKVAAWVDDKLVGFVDTYLGLETIEQYHTDNLVTDPVCGMTIDKALAAGHMEFQGQTYYFCVEQCQAKFAEDPRRYLDAVKNLR